MNKDDAWDRKMRIFSILQKKFNPVKLQVSESEVEGHFVICISSLVLRNMTRLEAERTINSALAEEFISEIPNLQIVIPE